MGSNIGYASVIRPQSFFNYQKKKKKEKKSKLFLTQACPLCIYYELFSKCLFGTQAGRTAILETLPVPVARGRNSGSPHINNLIVFTRKDIYHFVHNLLIRYSYVVLNDKGSRKCNLIIFPKEETPEIFGEQH